MGRFYQSKQCLRSPLVVRHWLFTFFLLYDFVGDHSFHFHSKKFEEKLSNTDDTQMPIGVCLKGERFSIAMF